MQRGGAKWITGNLLFNYLSLLFFFAFFLSWGSRTPLLSCLPYWQSAMNVTPARAFLKQIEENSHFPKKQQHGYIIVVGCI